MFHRVSTLSCQRVGNKILKLQNSQVNPCKCDEEFRVGRPFCRSQPLHPCVSTEGWSLFRSICSAIKHSQARGAASAFVVYKLRSVPHMFFCVPKRTYPHRNQLFLQSHQLDFTCFLFLPLVFYTGKQGNFFFCANFLFSLLLLVTPAVDILSYSCGNTCTVFTSSCSACGVWRDLPANTGWALLV